MTLEQVHNCEVNISEEIYNYLKMLTSQGSLVHLVHLTLLNLYRGSRPVKKKIY